MTFDALTASRRDWIENTLRPWCQQASLKDLRRAETEWFDIAGRADVKATLWTWAWERFPDLVHPEMAGVNETHEVLVELTDGTTLRGFPDNRASQRGMLVLITTPQPDTSTASPIDIDRMRSVQRI